MPPVIFLFTVPVDFKIVQCLSNLRKGSVALSNVRVKGPGLGRAGTESRLVPHPPEGLNGG